jgi:ribose transport system permease protein
LANKSAHVSQSLAGQPEGRSLGGTAITGGRGSMVGILNNGLNLMSVSPYTQKVLKDVIILLAIYAGSFKRNR